MTRETPSPADAKANGDSFKAASSPQAITLPKGGGAIRGIGEKFAANPVTGTGSMTVPIATSPGRSGFGPQFALSYDSGAGNGPFGFGWSLSLPQITRKTDKGLPQYDDAQESNVFLLSGAEDLVPLLNPDGSRFTDTTTAPGFTIHRYRPRIEGLFARIERWTRQSDGALHWRSISRDNILSIYGQDENARIADPADDTRIFTWLICETRDDKGNAVLYKYKSENGTGVDLAQTHERNRGDRNDPRRTTNRYLKRIHYGNRVPLLDDTGQRPRFLPSPPVPDTRWMFEVVLDYGEHDANTPMPDDAGEWAHRNDPFSTYRSTFEVRTTPLCQRVPMFHHFAGEPDVGTDCLVRSTDFTYSHEQGPPSARNPVYPIVRAVTQSCYRRHDGAYLRRSLPPVVFEYTQPIVQDTVQEVDAASLENLPIGVDGATYRWADLHGEGIPGILTEQAVAIGYGRKCAPAFETGSATEQARWTACQPQTLLTFTKSTYDTNDFDDDDDAWRTPLPAEVFTYGLTGHKWSGTPVILKFDAMLDDLTNDGDDLTLVSYGDHPDRDPKDAKSSGEPQKVASFAPLISFLPSLHPRAMRPSLPQRIPVHTLPFIPEHFSLKGLHKFFIFVKCVHARSGASRSSR